MTGLHALYVSTDGDNWKWKGPIGHWDFSIPNVNPCLDDWQGLACNNECSIAPDSTCIIVSIDLERFPMNGNLPTEIGLMISVTSMILFSNSFKPNSYVVHNICKLEVK